MDPYPKNKDARTLEDEFFAKQSAALLEKLRQKMHMEDRRRAMREAVPNSDDALVDHLLDIGLQPAEVVALVLVPLILVAWADGRIEPSERAALMKAAEERGVKAGSVPGRMLEDWLERRPAPRLLQAWKRYVRAVWGTLGDPERRKVQERMLELARGVAQAAGGFLGLGSKISPAEQAILDEMEQALG